MHHETTEIEYWSNGVLEWWALKIPLLHYSNTPSLRSAVVVAVMMLSGCMLGPDYKRPSVGIPSQFRVATTSPVDSLADLEWFEVFKDEHLQELIRVALAQNYDLRDAIARVDAARAN